jgi:CHAT domain-containing protein/tetratricopeptide (TPR) repeat protein
LLERQALSIYEAVLGPRHPETARRYNNLACNLDFQGRFKEAEPLLRKALAVHEKALGPKHLLTALTVNNLAYNLDAQRRAKEAEPLLRKALAIYEEVFGSRHPDTARSYNNLAGNLRAQGRVKEAETLQRKALAVFEDVLGPRHPDTATGYANLGANLQIQQRAREAGQLFLKALTIREAVLGTGHPDTAFSYNSLAYSLQAQGRTREAEPLWQKGADSIEAARLRVAASALTKPVEFAIQPHLGLAACRAHLGQSAAAWAAAEAELARGLLDQLASRAGMLHDPAVDRRNQDRASRLVVLDNLLIPLLAREQPGKADQRRDEFLKERGSLENEIALEVAQASRKAVLPLADIQERLAPDDALLFWVDLPSAGDHWGCVLRRGGMPIWVRLKGSGPNGAWTADDHTLPRLFRDDLARAEADAYHHARRLATQRLTPLEPYLAATPELPPVRHLIVIPVGRMAGVPVEALTDRYRISYAPSGTVFARLRQKHRPLETPTLLALGNPNFTSLADRPPPAPPAYGLCLSLVLPGGNAARAGLRGGDVLLTYAGHKLAAQSDLKVTETGPAIPVTAWRDGQVLDQLWVDSGKLGVVLSADSPAVALRKHRDLDLLADARDRSEILPLPGTRLEVAALASLLPRAKATVLLGSLACEQELNQLASTDKLKGYRLLHLATHGTVDPVSAAHSALLLARDRLPAVDEQSRLSKAGKKVPTGRLTVGDIAETWELDADLVTLSACQTGLGPDGGGEGLLGFSQVLLGKGARSLLLSLWKVDDTATALLMTRFYQNLLGKRDGLQAALPKAEALQEAKQWLRSLRRAEVEHLAGALAKGVVRSEEEPAGRVLPAAVPVAPLPAGPAPFAHPRYWAAFILIGDPD